jgi:hypothetical protein
MAAAWLLRVECDALGLAAAPWRPRLDGAQLEAAERALGRGMISVKRAGAAVPWGEGLPPRPEWADAPAVAAASSAGVPAGLSRSVSFRRGGGSGRGGSLGAVGAELDVSDDNDDVDVDDDDDGFAREEEEEEEEEGPPLEEEEEEGGGSTDMDDVDVLSDGTDAAPGGGAPPAVAPGGGGGVWVPPGGGGAAPPWAAAGVAAAGAAGGGAAGAGDPLAALARRNSISSEDMAAIHAALAEE